MKPTLSPYYYPTNIVLIDDNEAFLNSMSLYLSKSFRCKTFTDPQEALAFINTTNNTESEQNPLSQRNHRWQENVFKYMTEKQFNDTKHNELSVVIADYDMPNINGIALCSRVKNSAIRKVLLTGCASSKDVVSAFNEDIIHYYIDKQTDNLLSEVERVVSEMQKSYFRESLRSLTMSFIKREAPCFLDAALADYFDDTCLLLGIDEYYFLPDSSRFVLLSQNQENIMMVLDDNDIEEHIQIIKDEEGKKEWIEKLQSREYVPFFNSQDGFYTPETQGDEEPMIRATRIEGEQNYYCAVVQNQLDTLSSLYRNKGQKNLH